MITIVSGLPRSGTSLIMQMLEKGGMEILTDNVRKADESNPRGYYEYEKMKSLQRDSSWLVEADGKAIKVIAQLLKYLPQQFEYKVIFIERNIKEVLISQQKMLEKLGQKHPSNNDILSKVFQKQIADTQKWLERQNNISSLFLSYTDALFEQRATVENITSFLGLDLEMYAMINVIDQSLYRERVQIK